MIRITLLTLLLIPITGCSPPASQQVIQCPAAQTGQIPGTVNESAAQLASAGQQLNHGNDNAIREVAGSFRQRHPDARPGAVINFLLTAYCPALNADRSLDQNARGDAMKTFARKAQAILR